ncbi:MAG: penicillin-binding protein activator [Rhizobiaceae bacterium]|nr:penicillin-binding protein activator [Rhizobiaceae bacterium]
MALTRRRFLSGLSLFAVTAGGCQSVPSGLPDQPTGVTPVVTETLPPAQGEMIGSGPVRVAMLLPIGGSGNGAKIGIELRNSARLAVEDFGSDTLQIVVKDTAGQPELALSMATEALAEGSSALLGPVFAPEVSRIAPTLRQSGKIAIAFSSDQTVAGNGIYLNSFLPQGIADRTVTYAFSQGLRTFVALVPNNAAGAVMERQLQETLQTLGGEVLQVERYEPNDGSVQTAAAAIAAKANEAQAIFIPDGGPSPNAIAAALRSNGVDIAAKKLLGTGLWNSSSLADPALAGAWLADVDQARINEFKTRYRQKFGAEPSTNAVLGYDSVSLAVSIVKVHGPVGFTAGVIEARSGFTGYGGVFRFGSDGSNQRAYTVYEIEPGGRRKIVSPSPTSFSGA